MMVDVLAIKEIQKKRGSKIFCAYVNEKNERKLGWLELTKEIRESDLYQQIVKKKQERKRKREEDDNPARKRLRQLSNGMSDVEEMQRIFSYDDSWVEPLRKEHTTKLRKVTENHKKWLEENLKLDQSAKLDNEDVQKLVEENERLQKDLDDLHRESEKMKRELQRNRGNLNEGNQESDQIQAKLRKENADHEDQAKALHAELIALQKRDQIQQEIAEEERRIAEKSLQAENLRSLNIQHERVLHGLVEGMHGDGETLKLDFDDNLDLNIKQQHDEDQILQTRIQWQENKSNFYMLSEENGEELTKIDNEKLPELVLQLFKLPNH